MEILTRALNKKNSALGEQKSETYDIKKQMRI